MQTKDLLGLILLLVGVAGGVVVTSLSQRARDAAFFVLIATGGFAERLNIEFGSQYWYRGTTRGFEFSYLDILAVSVLLGSIFFPRYRESPRFWPVSFGPWLLYFFYACFSVAIATPKLYGLFELSKILRGFLVFLAAAWFVQTPREWRVLIFGLCGAIALEGVLCLKQRYLGGLYRAAGSLDHANSLSMYLCAVSPVVAAAASAPLGRIWQWLAMGAAALATLCSVLTVSRAGIPIFFFIMGGTLVFTVSWRFSFKHVLGVACVGAGMLGLASTQWDNLRARFQVERSLEEEYLDEHSEGRGHYFLLAKSILDDEFLGVGLNNWSYWVCKKYGADRGLTYQDYDDLDYIPPKAALSDYLYAPPAHALAALTAGELGWPGLFLFGWVWFRWFRAGAKFLRRRFDGAARILGVGCFFAVCGVFLQNVTEWVYRQTPIMFTFHVILGTLANLYFQRRQAELAQAETPARFEEEGDLEEPLPAMNSL